MKLAVCNEFFEGWKIEKVFNYAAEIGCEGVEIAPFTLAENVNRISASRRRNIRKAGEKAGGKGGRKPSYKKRHFKLAKNTLTYAASAKPDAKVLGIIQLSGGSVKQTGENVTVVDSQGRKNGAHAHTQPVAPSCPAHHFD